MSNSNQDRKENFRRFFSWRQGFMESDLPATTKLVLHTIATHMNELGEGAFPSVETIMRESSLSRQPVVGHIKKAVETRWLRKHLNQGRGRGWKHSGYSISWPYKAVNQADCRNVAVYVAADGGLRETSEAVYQVDSNPPLELSLKNSKKEGARKADRPARSVSKGNGSGDGLFGQMREYAERTWQERFGSKPTWGPKDYAGLARILRCHRDLELKEFSARWDRYLRDGDRFVAERMGHSLAFFCSRFDAYIDRSGLDIPEIRPYEG